MIISFINHREIDGTNRQYTCKDNSQLNRFGLYSAEYRDKDVQEDRTCEKNLVQRVPRLYMYSICVYE